MRIHADRGHILHVAELTVDCKSSKSASVVCRVSKKKQAGLMQCQWHTPFPRRVIELRGAHHLQLPSSIPEDANKKNMTGMMTLITGLLNKVEQSVEHLSLAFQYLDLDLMNGASYFIV